MVQSRLCWQAASVLVPFLAIAAAHSQQATLPNTPAGRALTEWLEAFNSGDRDRIAAFQRRYSVQGPPTDALADFRTRTGGFDLLSVTKSEPLHVEFVVKERNSATRANGMLDVTASDPPKVTGPMLTALPPNASRLLSGDELQSARASVPYQRFFAWLDAFNTGDRSRIAAFLASTWPSRNSPINSGKQSGSGQPECGTSICMCLLRCHKCMPRFPAATFQLALSAESRFA